MVFCETLYCQENVYMIQSKIEGWRASEKKKNSDEWDREMLVTLLLLIFLCHSLYKYPNLEKNIINICSHTG